MYPDNIFSRSSWWYFSRLCNVQLLVLQSTLFLQSVDKLLPLTLISVRLTAGFMLIVEYNSNRTAANVIFSFDVRGYICIYSATKYRSVIPQCRKHKSERIIHPALSGVDLGASAFVWHVTDRHHEFRMFCPLPIFRMRSIYEYITKSPGKLRWTWKPFVYVKRRGFARQDVLVRWRGQY